MADKKCHLSATTRKERSGMPDSEKMDAERSRQRERPVTLEAVVKEIRRVSSKLDRMAEMVDRILQRLPESGGLTPLDAVKLLSLPDELRKTAMVMLEVEEATASEVAEVTGRTKAVESSCLNRLVRMGLLKRKRRGRMVYFSSCG